MQQYGRIQWMDMAGIPRINSLYDYGYVKSIFSYADYDLPEDMQDDLLKFAKTRNLIEAGIERISEFLWRMRVVEEVQVQEPEPRKIHRRYNFYIIHHGRFWEFHTNERRSGYIIVIRLINFLPKLDFKFLPPDAIMSLAKTYELDDLLAFSAKRDYFSFAQASELRMISDDVGVMLRSSPGNIWDHYHKLVEEEPIGPLSVETVNIRVPSGQKTCTMWINTSGQILQTAGDRDIFYEIREKVLQIFNAQAKWENYIPVVETQVVRDEEKRVTIRGEKFLRRGRRFAIELSKPIEERDYEKLKGLFIYNVKESGLVGIVEDEIMEKSFVTRTTGMKGGGDVVLTANVGRNDIVVDPQPSTTLRIIEQVYKAILEKFDTKATLVEPEIVEA